MLEAFRQFISGNYEPHGYCLLWQPGLIWTHVISDTLIAAAYFSIPVALIRFVRSREDIAFGWIIWLFALFIMACGATHVRGVWNLWHGDYGAEAIVKVITAAASVPTAILLWQLVPRALAIPSPTQLHVVNRQLRASIDERDAALDQVKAEIAQRERAEAALLQAQKMDAIGQLTGGIAHDFNNLLQAVGGNLDLISAQPAESAKVARWAENASKGIVRGTKLTGQLLAFSRTQRLELRPLDLNGLIEGLQDLLTSSVGSLVSCELDLESTLCHVEGDPTQIELAVLNLAINARDAMPRGGSLTIATRQVTVDAADVDLPAGAYVELSVADTGEGMPPDVLARALDPFFTTKGIGAGTGLGLSMAFGVATQSHGTLRLKSTVGVGTTVTMLLPCTDAAAPHHVTPSPPTAIAADALRGLRVAVIDDDPEVRHFVADCLTGSGALCQAFDGGHAFLERFAAATVDLILLDFAMPGLNGAEVARRARQIDADVPLVIMTGYADSAELDEIPGNLDIIRKPFPAATLVNTVKAALVDG